MRIKNLILVLSTTLILTGCMGPGEYWEPTTYGVRNSQWAMMSDSQRYYAQKSYEDAQHAAEQRKIEKKMQKQNAKLLKMQMKNAKLEQHRIKAEIARANSDH